jgi:hypothetical protein
VYPIAALHLDPVLLTVCRTTPVPVVRQRPTATEKGVTYFLDELPEDLGEMPVDHVKMLRYNHDQLTALREKIQLAEAAKAKEAKEAAEKAAEAQRKEQKPAN